MKNTWVQRSLLLVFLLLLSVFLFYIGKGHALLIDTNALNVDGKTYTAPAMMEVSLDGKEAESMGPSERSMANVGGPSHKLKIEIFNDSGESEKVVEHSFSIPTFLDTAVISIPAILAGLKEHEVTVFVPADREESAAEHMVTQEDSPLSEDKSGEINEGKSEEKN